MQIIDKNKSDKPKYTVLPKYTGEFPSPGKFVAIDFEMFSDFVESVNQVLAEENQFLSTVITQTRYNQNPQTPLETLKNSLVGPCINQPQSDTQFPIIFEVEGIRQDGNNINIQLVSPFINLPEGINFEFIDKYVDVIELEYGPEIPIMKSVDSLSKGIGFKAKHGDQYMEFESYGKLPEKSCKWLASSCVKVFSMIIDLDGALTNNLKMNSTAEQLQTRIKSVPKQLKAYDLSSQTGETSSKIKELVKKIEPTSDKFQIEFHPLFDYTESLMAKMSTVLREELGVELSLNELTTLFDAGFREMTKSSIIINPNTDDE